MAMLGDSLDELGGYIVHPSVSPDNDALVGF
jgi:hypothetical protein